MSARGQRRTANAPAPAPPARQQHRHHLHLHHRRPRRQRGALLICFALILLSLLGFLGLALDLARVYNRSDELQNLADTAALTAAAALDGTPAGVTKAADLAAQIAAAHKYAYGLGVTWDRGALRFAGSPDAADGAWLSEADAMAAAAVGDMLFARVDTGRLAPAQGAVDLSFVPALGDGMARVNVSARAVAGRTSVKITPFAVCALSAQPAAERLSAVTPAVSELVEFGFRRGVGYNLLNLNPDGATAVYYLLDPVTPSGTAGSAANTSAAAIAPYICSGSMPRTRITTGTVSVAPGPATFQLADQFNSRFDVYTGTCNMAGAPPDANIRPYPVTTSWWSGVTPAAPAAAPANPSAGVLATVAELGGIPPAAYTAASYGVLWSFAPAAQYAATQPAAGYTAIARTSWNKLYPSATGAPAANSFYPTLPNATPYATPSGAFFLAPSAAHLPVAQRRVLNIPLLKCPVPGGGIAQAQVAGIGRFLMTAKASGALLAGEFGGMVAEQTLGVHVELYR